MKNMTAAELAAEKARVAAVREAVTILTGTVTTVDATGVTVDFGGGSVVPNVPVLHPYTPRVGAVVRVASQGAMLLVLGGVKPDPRPTTVTYFDAGTYSTSSTTQVSLSTPARVAFVAPPAGAVIFHAKARLTPTATARAFASGRLLSSGLATLVTTSASMIDAPAGGGSMAAGSSWRFGGLTPGATYYVELVYASGTAGQTVSIGGVYLIAQPEA